jgi:signal transduction histidine kinase
MSIRSQKNVDAAKGRESPSRELRWTIPAAARVGVLLIASIGSGFLLRRELFGEFGGFFAFLFTGIASYFAGPWAALLAPVIVLQVDRTLRIGEAAFTTPLKMQELTNWLFFTLVMFAIGWAGRLTRKAIGDLKQREANLRTEALHKDRFLATLAHELRNPLAPLRNAIDVLELTVDSPPDPDSLREVHQTLRRQVEHLVQIVDDLLDVHRIGTGKVRLLPTETTLQEVVHCAIETIRPQALQLKHDLSVNACDAPLRIFADRTRILQVLLNLLGNSIKFTPVGGQIVVEVVRDGDYAVVTVTDSGVGIAAEVLPSVFDLFAQFDNVAEKENRGLGLGLNLSKRFVEMHHGAIEARSEGLGKGSQFIVRLPISEERANQTR